MHAVARRPSWDFQVENVTDNTGKLLGLVFTAVDITLTTDIGLARQAGVTYLPATSGLKTIEVLSGTVTLLGSIQLPGVDLRIVTRQLLCSRPWTETCIISTSAEPPTTAIQLYSAVVPPASTAGANG